MNYAEIRKKYKLKDNKKEGIIYKKRTVKFNSFALRYICLHFRGCI